MGLMLGLAVGSVMEPLVLLSPQAVRDSSITTASSRNINLFMLFLLL